MNLQTLTRLAPALLVAAAGLTPGLASAQTLNVVTAGDQNMVDYVNNFLGPRFEKLNPGVSVKAVGTGPGDAGSQKIYEKLSAQSKAGNAAWDVDVAVIHQRGAATMVKENLLASYRSQIATDKLVTRDTANNALGQNVDGFVIPMFHSQIALAYNPDLVKAPPKSFNELETWVQAEPEAVRLQRRQGRHVGRRLRDGLCLGQQWPGQDARRRARTTPRKKAAIDKSLGEPEGVQQVHRLHPGQCRHAGHAQPRRDRDGPGVGRHVLHLAGRRQAEPEVEARATRARPARPADVLRGAGQGRQRRGGAQVRRVRRQPRDPGRGHRQAVQLVPRHRCAACAAPSSTPRAGTSCSPTSSPKRCRSTGGRSRCSTISPTSSRATSVSS